MRAFVFPWIAALCLAASSSARADFLSGRELLQKCQSQDAVLGAQCLGYIEGVSGLMDMVRRSNSRPVCVPVTVSAGTVRDVVVRGLLQDVDNQRSSAASNVLHYIGQKWGCDGD